jgi:hypothetical protein
MKEKLLLLKFSEARFIDDMYNNEYLYFNKFEGFRSSSPDPSGRLDPREGNLRNVQLYGKLELSINIGEKSFKLGEAIANPENNDIQYCEHNETPSLISCSLYSMKLDANASDIVIDDRVLELGSKAIVIFDVLKFWEILDDALMKDDMGYKRDFVKYYYHKEHDGELGYHYKHSDFSYQNEYRIIKQVSDPEPTSVKLAGLKEISRIVDIESLLRD